MASVSSGTGQGVGVGLRAAAIIVDTVILGVVCYLLALLTGQTTESGFSLEGGPFFIAVLIHFGYYVVLEAMWAATPGKLATGLRVVRENGGAIGWRESVIRNVLRFVDGFVFYIVGAILVWTSPKRQRLGDRIAETLVVRHAKPS